MTEITINTEATIKANGRHTHGNSKPVINLDTGDTYASATDAAEALGCGQHAVSWCCLGKSRTCKGYHLAYVAHASQNVDILANRIRAMNEDKKANDRMIVELNEKASRYNEVLSKVSENEHLKDELCKANEELAQYRAYKKQKQLVAHLEDAFHKAFEEYQKANELLREMQSAL